MNNNFYPDNGTNNFSFSTTGNDTLTFTNSGTTDIWLPDPLLSWLPEASQRKKYFPSWHLVRSYGQMG